MEAYIVEFRKKGSPYGRPIAKKKVRAFGFDDALSKAHAIRKYSTLTWYAVTNEQTQRTINLAEVREDLYGGLYESLDSLVKVKYEK